jgi:tRNA A-37 threonylcarbamoyl transferase component Bud32
VPDLDARLRAALAGRYEIRTELARGVVAIVYAAEDRAAHRQVALKVLRPELATVLTRERFLREIRLTSGLDHPNILPLLDSGGGETGTDDATDLLFYVMPLVAGSLRDRLAREGPLPLEEALRITHAVAAALGHAHEQGVVHRDIKPENILLENEHVWVTDFGIAKAVTAAGEERLTHTGIAVGTPAYMSPEQGSGAAWVDGRSDLYSLGCVLFELLTGETPYTGTTPQALWAKKLSEPVPRVSVVRESVPAPVEAALTRVLARSPADRFATAAELSAALQIDAAAYRRRQRLLKRARRVALAAATAAVMAAAAYGVARYRAATTWKSADLDPDAVAILPFEVHATSPSLVILDEGIIDLLYPVLSGDAGLRAIEPNPLLLTLADVRARGEWVSADAALRLGAQFRASQVLEGRVAEAGTRVTFNAWMRRVPDGATVAQSTVTGSADSVHALIQQLAIELLGDRLGESRTRLAGLVGRPSEAVNAYLAGTRALRAGRYGDAVRLLGRAVELDSTFALAALRLAETPGGPAWQALPIARAHRASLGRREQAVLTYQLVSQRMDTVATEADNLTAVRAWLDVAPDDAVAWGTYAARLRTVGSVIPIAHWESEARRALERAWALDSSTPDVVTRHVGTALSLEDLEWLRRVGPRYLAVADTLAPDWIGFRWTIAKVLGDSVTVRALRARARGGDPRVVDARVRARVQFAEILLGEPHTDTDLLREHLRARVVSGTDSIRHAFDLGYEAIWKGRMRQLIEVLTGPLGLISWNRRIGRQTFVIDFWLMYPGLDSAAALAAESIRVMAEEPALPYVAGVPVTQPPHLRCYHLLYRAARGDTSGVRSAARALVPWFRELDMEGVCPALAEALVESHDAGRRDTPALDSLETKLRRGTRWEFPTNAAIPVLARLRRQRGQHERALSAARMHLLGEPFFWQSRVALLKEEGDLAVIVGDTTGALEAYQRYLAFRTDPDDLGAPQVDSVRAALDALLRARG